MSDRLTARFGAWKSPVTSDLIVAEAIGLDDVLLDGNNVYWVEARPQEGGRHVLVHRAAAGSSTDVNPPPLNARTRVHEYGGAAALVHHGAAYFSNYSDQQLYRIAPGGEPQPLTPAPASPDQSLRYADGRIDGSRHRWIGVRQDHLTNLHEPVNSIVAIDLAAGGAGVVLAEGYDFYSNPRLSPDGRRLAWLCWNHPNMPWVETELWIAEVAADGHLVEQRKVAGGNAVSVFQPEWSPDGRLYFVSDQSGWWNLYRLEGDGNARNLCPMAAEFGQPQWVFGQSTYGFLSNREIVCAFSKGTGTLARLDVETGTVSAFNLPFTEYESVRCDGGRVAFRGGSPSAPSAIVLLDAATGKFEILRTAMADDPTLRPYYSAPQAIDFPSASGRIAHALFYPPKNPDFEAPKGELPPLVVKCHGGPTAAASSSLDLGIQFWTSRGIAVVDVNYGGSTGYGRAYRDLLHSQWGVVDVEDCAAAVKYLAGRALVDPHRAVITGGSAGGFTVLACLTSSRDEIRNCFVSGASHYGVSDVAALAQDTHKFESRYLDWLIAPYSDADPRVEAQYRQVYRQRSPVHACVNLSVPVAFFQGTEDMVVPPNQTELMVDALHAKGIAVSYLLFEGEQHGFRQAANIKRALDAELCFFAAEAFKVCLRF